MFDKITNFMDKYLSTPMAKLSEQRHLRAVRDGIISTLPLIIVSSMLMVFAFSWQWLPETWGFTMWVKANAGNILLPYRMSMYIMTLYAVFGFGYSLSRSYKLDGLTGGILATMAFLLTIIPASLPAVTDAIKTAAAGSEELTKFLTALPQGGGFYMPMQYLGSAGMFVGIVISFFAVEVYRFTTVTNFRITMPEQVPSSVARSFEALTPVAIIMLVVAAVTMWLKIDVHAIMTKLVAPLISTTDSLPAIIVICTLGMFFWVFGIHGWSIVGAVARPIWVVLLDTNIQEMANGVANANLPAIGAEPFYQWFIMIGGSGCTIGLAILFLVKSKSSYGKLLGKTAFLPAVFNINEPMIFGAPIVLNPMLMLPFIITPSICATIAWFATKLNLINHVTFSAPWVLPAPIGAFLATNGDWRAAVLACLLIVLSTLIYYPFFKMYDNKLLAEEQAGDAAEAEAAKA